LKTDGDQQYQVHNGPRACPGQRSKSIGSGLQSTTLGANSISNNRISIGCHYPTRSPVASGRSRTIVATSNHYEAIYIDALVSPDPDVYLLQVV